jgi:hypothetical protein
VTQDEKRLGIGNKGGMEWKEWNHQVQMRKKNQVPTFFVQVTPYLRGKRMREQNKHTRIVL